MNTTLPEATNIYFIGIAGIGMSALAQLFFHQGKQVRGSDNGERPTTTILEAKGITIKKGYDASNLPDDTDLVVYTDAVGEQNPELMKARERRITTLSYFEALGEATLGKRTVAIAGTPFRGRPFTNCNSWEYNERF